MIRKYWWCSFAAVKNFPRIIFILCLCCMGIMPVVGQTVIAFQGFEGTGADNWTFTPPTQNNVAPILPAGVANYGAGYAATGNFSIRAGGGGTGCGSGGTNCINGAGSGGTCMNNSNGDIVQFAPINIQCYSGVTISAAYRTHVFCVGTGLDGPDRLYFEVSLNGGAWTTVATVSGTNNCVWDYTTNPVVCGGTPVANPYVYNVPAGTQTVAFRTRVQRDRSDEVYYIDNVKITGTGGSLAPVSIQHINP